MATPVVTTSVGSVCSTTAATSPAARCVLPFNRCFANAGLLQVPLKPIQRHFIQRQLHQPQAHLIDGEIMKAAVLAETDQTAARVYPVSHFCVLLWKNEILPSAALHGHAEIEKPAAGAECVELLGEEQ